MRAPPPPTLGWSGERKGEKGATKLPTASHHLLFRRASRAGPFPISSLEKNCLFFFFFFFLIFKERKKYDIYVADVPPPSASLECAPGYTSRRGEAEAEAAVVVVVGGTERKALDKLGPKGMRRRVHISAGISFVTSGNGTRRALLLE